MAVPSLFFQSSGGSDRVTLSWKVLHTVPVKLEDFRGGWFFNSFYYFLYSNLSIETSSLFWDRLYTLRFSRNTHKAKYSLRILNFKSLCGLSFIYYFVYLCFLNFS